MGGELELYQQEIDMASKPVLARLEHYRKVTQQVRELLKEYFFNGSRTLKLTEAGQADEVVFNFNSVSEAMKICLADENILSETAQRLLNPARHPGFVNAFDSHILNSALPLELQENKCLYMFKPDKPYTPMAQVFMQQFAYALSAYRICLGVYEIYYAVTFYNALQTEQLKKYIESSQSLKQPFDGDVDLLVILKQLKAVQKEVKSLLRGENIHAGMDNLKKDLDTYSNILDELLSFCAIHLQNCYKEFPNNPILWMLHDRSWHALLKTLSGLIYADQYTCSTLYGTLEIKREFIGLIKSEIDHYTNVAFTKTPLLKIEILRKAARLIAETKIDIYAKLAEKRIELVEAPKGGIFSHPGSQNIYELMLKLYKTDKNNSPTELDTDEENNEDFSY